jgi:outer membrane protein assembly factor BamA
MLDELEALRVQKAEIEKKEQELIKAIQQKAARQAERIRQLIIAPPAAGAPLRISRIMIEGNERTTDGKIMKIVNLLPGEVLEYPELEKARMRLANAGFQMASVEVIGNGDSSFIEILIKVVENEP